MQIGDGSATYDINQIYGISRAENYVLVAVGDAVITLKGTDSSGLTLSDKPNPVIIRGNKAQGSDISNTVSGAKLNGTRANDTITNSGTRAAIDGKAGNDNISLGSTASNNFIVYNAGDGNDFIQGFNATSSISIGGGNYSKTKVGNDLILTVGDEKITLEYAANLSTVNIIGTEAEYPLNIVNSDSDLLIRGTKLNDTLANDGGEDVSIDAGAGNDSVSNSGNNVTLDGGAGDDLISLDSTADNTVNAGTGNDTIQLVSSNGPLIEYTKGDGNDLIEGFDESATLSIAGGKYTSQVSGDDIIVTVSKSKITLASAAELEEFNIDGEEGQDALDTVNNDNNTTIYGTEFEDTITNNGASVTVDGGKGSDTLNHANLFKYNAGDDNDFITDYRAGDTISIDSALTFSRFTSDDDMILKTSDGGSITLVNAANKKITAQGKEVASYINFTVTDSGVTYESNIDDSVVSASYNFKQHTITLFEKLKDYLLGVQNSSSEPLKLTDAYNFGTSTLRSNSTIGYMRENGKVLSTLTSTQFNDVIALGENAALHFGGLDIEMTAAGKITATGAKNILFGNSSSALVTAPGGAEIAIGTGKFVVNNLPIISASGEGTISVADNGLSFTGYGAQVVDLEVARENYYGSLAPMVVAYNSTEKNYTLQNTACVKTLAYDPVQLNFDFSDATKNYTVNGEKYAYYKVNDKEFLVANDKRNINVITANAAGFKIQSKELNAANVSRITIDEQITFKGTEIDFDGVKTTYTQGKEVIYSLDGKEISLSGAATVTTSADSKTYNCVAGSYTVNGKTFTTTDTLTFTADSSKIQIPLDANNQVIFDGVTASNSHGGEIVFDLTNDKIFVPDGSTLTLNNADAVKFNLAAGDFTVNGNEISCVTELEISADKDNISIPLGNLPVTINDAKITGSDAAQIDYSKTIVLPDARPFKTSPIIFSNSPRKILPPPSATPIKKFCSPTTPKFISNTTRKIKSASA